MCSRHINIAINITINNTINVTINVTITIPLNIITYIAINITVPPQEQYFILQYALVACNLIRQRQLLGRKFSSFANRPSICKLTYQFINGLSPFLNGQEFVPQLEQVRRKQILPYTAADAI